MCIVCLRVCYLVSCMREDEVLVSLSPNRLLGSASVMICTVGERAVTVLAVFGTL